MVCIYCNSTLRVTNSRPQKRLNRIWRRRFCDECRATFTTEEEIATDKSIVVSYPDGSTAPFIRERLFMSLYESLKHSQNALEAAKQLSYTVSQDLIKNSLNGARIDVGDIIHTGTTVLKHYNEVAGLHYEASHKK